MKVNPKQFKKDGFIVLRGVVPPQRLEDLRRVVEVMVDRQKAASAAQRKEGDPIGGAWYSSSQARVN